MINLNDKKLELEYPCSWEYKLVVLESCNIKKCVKEVIFDRVHSLNVSKSSSKGKFKSYNLKLLVHNDDDRTEIFKLLGDHSEIKMVL